MDPEPLYSRTVSMTWGYPCKLEVRAAAAAPHLSIVPYSSQLDDNAFQLGYHFA